MSTQLSISDRSTLPPLDALRVCIVAENASFRFGGEASLPLHYFSRLRARDIEAWLIVHGRTKAELQALLPADQDRIRYIPDSWYHKLIWRLSPLLPRRIAEATFGILTVLINQLIQRGMVKRLIQQCGVNIVHQPIPVSPKTPSFISGFDIPVIIGPMNGGMDYPAAFRRSESLGTRVAVAIARASADFVNRIIAGKIRANVLLVANERTRNALPRGTRGKIIEIPENGVDLTVWSLPPKTVPSAVPPRFLFVGRLVEWKRLDLVLHALAEVPEAQLDVIGDGQMRITWTALAGHLGIADRVRWLGWLQQAECAQHIHGATALLLPSIYECGGAVVLEAMACGSPVVATAWGGPMDYVDASCGILIEPAGPDAIVSGFVDAIRKLAADPALRVQLGTVGRKRAGLLYDWNLKIDRIVEIYRQCIFDRRS